MTIGNLDDALRSGARNDREINSKLIIKVTSILDEKVDFIAARKPFESVSETLKTSYKVLRPSPEPCSSGQNIQSNLVFGPKMPNGEFSAHPSTSSNVPFVSAQNLTLSRKEDDGLPEPSIHIDSRVAFSMDWDNQMKPIALGLLNYGNTCFMNSVLQALTHTAPLVNYVLHHHELSECKAVGTGFCAICHFQAHLRFMREKRKLSPIEPVLPKSMVTKIRSIMKTYHPGRQEDAHEFLRFFVEAMQSARLFEYKHKKLDVYSKETNVISRIFGGFYRNLVSCNSCQEKSSTFDPFLDISLEINGRLSGLEEALKNFTRVEELSGSNAYKCLSCKRSVKANKRYSIHRAPNILTVHLKRFDHFGKIGKVIQYKEKLDIRPYMSQSMGNPVLYKLFAIIVHQGQSTHSGHYYAYVRNTRGEWHIMDDSRVGPVSRESVFGQQAYLLFYQRQETPIAPVKPQERVKPENVIKPIISPSIPEPKKIKINLLDNVKATQKVEPLKRESVPCQPKPMKINVCDRAKGGLLGVRPKQTQNVKLVPYDDDDDSPVSSRSDSPKTNSVKRKAEPTPKEPSMKPSFNVFSKLRSSESKPEMSSVKVQKVEPNVTSNSTKADSMNRTPSQIKMKIKLDKDKNKGTVEMINGDEGEKISINKDCQPITEETPQTEHEEKRRKKKKKKHKKKHRRHESEERNDDSQERNEQGEEPSHSRKRRHSHESHRHDESSETKRRRRSDSESSDRRDRRKEDDPLSSLAAQAGRGYGHNVGTWDGKASSLDRHSSGQSSRRDSPFSDEEEPRREKKHKYKNHHDSRDRRPNENIFQKFQDNRNFQRSSRHHSYSRDPGYRTHHSRRSSHW